MQLQSFLEQSPLAIALLDGSGTILTCNKAFGTLAGNAGQQVLHTNLSAYIAPENRDELRQRFEQLHSQPSDKPLDIRFGGEGGATASLYLTALKEDDVVVAYLINTTEQKNLELRFAHSQKMQAVGQLAGGIAHDFNNLLTAMIGFCDLLLMRHPAGDQSFADIMQVKQNANRAANLVRQLLAFSRRQTLQPKTLDIAEVLAELSNLIRRLIGENIELKVIHGRDLWLVKVDQGQLEQVLINLAVNARDAMGKGGMLRIETANVTIDRVHRLPKNLISPTEEDDIVDGEYVRVDVVDTGHGIPLGMIRKIFEPFFSTKEVGSGTGLGLATVYGIVKQTGGYIYVASEENQGTTFSIFLKRTTDIETKQAAEDSNEAAEAAADLTGKATILLVEDEAPVRAFSARALRNKGYTVIEADCGEAALEQVAEHGPNIEVIITDVIMPGMNGPAMIEEIVKSHPDVKVIFISGYTEDAFAGTAHEGKDFNFLPKPFTLKQLAAKVKEVMG
ncbi:MAG: response regulator [Alphaproteobacteria bacterium]|nr:response regulator [Alphaproteobacteria bacterium]